MYLVNNNQEVNVSGDAIVDTLVDGTDFTAGTSYNITLTVIPGAKELCSITFDGVTQHHDQYSLSGSTITFTNVIPLNTSSIEVRTYRPGPTTIPADNSVSFAKLDNNLQSQLERRNVIINGNFDVWQRSTTASQTASDQAIRSADRFGYYGYGAARVDFKQSTDVPTYAESGVKSNYSLHIDVTTADATVTGDEGEIFYNVEGYDYAQLAGGNATLSFWVKSSVTGTYSLSIRNSGKDRSYVTEYTVNTADTWEKKTITIPLTETGGTWNYTNGIGLLINWTVYGDVASTGTLDTWQSANKVMSTNQVNLMSSATNNFRIAQVQLESGTEATPLVQRHFADELAKCQRYFEKSYSTDVDVATVTPNGRVQNAPDALTTYLNFGTTSFRTEKRDEPTMTVYNPNSGATGTGYNYSTTGNPAIVTDAISTGSFTAYVNNVSTSAAQVVGFHWTADTEL